MWRGISPVANHSPLPCTCCLLVAVCWLCRFCRFCIPKIETKVELWGVNRKEGHLLRIAGRRDFEEFWWDGYRNRMACLYYAGSLIRYRSSKRYSCYRSMQLHTPDCKILTLQWKANMISPKLNLERYLYKDGVPLLIHVKKYGLMN